MGVQRLDVRGKQPPRAQSIAATLFHITLGNVVAEGEVTGGETAPPASASREAAELSNRVVNRLLAV